MDSVQEVILENEENTEMSGVVSSNANEISKHHDLYLNS
jgi:hypothetical protein